MNCLTKGLVGLLLIGLSGAQSTDDTPNLQPVEEAEEDVTLKSFRRAFNYFDLDLLEQFGKCSENVFISPSSIKSTLALILEGSKGRSAEQISAALGINDINRPEIRETLVQLLRVMLNKTPNTDLEIENGVFVSNKLSLIPDYTKRARTSYNALVRKVDYSSPIAAAQVINSWVRNATHGLIPEVISSSSLSDKTSVILANALYFKGKWKSAFDIKNTRPRCFNTRRGCANTPMMQISDTFNYHFNTDLHTHVIELPYQDDEFSMLVLVPATGTDVGMVVRDLSHLRFSSVVSQMKPTDVLLELPKFDMEFSEDLSDFLKPLNIIDVFSTKANLSGIVTNEDVVISRIFHKTKIEVNEAGTKAAAASAAVVIPLMGGTPQNVSADRPFVFFIYHKSTNIIIFEGIFNEPENQIVTQSRINVPPPPANQQPRSSGGKSYNQFSYTY